MTIDWTKPLELEDGTPVRITYDWGDGGYTLERCDGAPFTAEQVGSTDEGCNRTVWVADGRGFLRDRPMRVRNVATKPDLPPDWAVRKACELSGYDGDTYSDLIVAYVRSNPVHAAFARYIAEHEQPPVDPVLEAARSICAEVVRNTQQERWVEGYLSGRFDNHHEVQHAVAAIRKLIDSSK